VRLRFKVVFSLGETLDGSKVLGALASRPKRLVLRSQQRSLPPCVQLTGLKKKMIATVSSVVSLSVQHERRKKNGFNA